jgi:carbon storage regulator
MLVLTRRQGEKIILGDDIELTVTSVKGKVVKLGISAPAHIKIQRGELQGPDQRRVRACA